MEARRLKAAPLLVPWSEGGLAEAPTPRAGAVIVPFPVDASGPPEPKDIAAITYGANPEKKGLDRVLAAWARDGRAGEELVVAGLDEAAGREWVRRAGDAAAGGAGRVRFTGMIPRDEYRALLRRARVFVTAPRREDYGIAQLEALADGCQLVTNEAPGPYAALPLARTLDPRLVGDALDIRTALDDPRPGGRAAVAPFTRAAVDRVVAQELLPRLRSFANSGQGRVLAT